MYNDFVKRLLWLWLFLVSLLYAGQQLTSSIRSKLKYFEITYSELFNRKKNHRFRCTNLNYVFSMDRRTSHWCFRFNIISYWESWISNNHNMPKITQFWKMGSVHQGVWSHECCLSRNVRNSKSILTTFQIRHGLRTPVAQWSLFSLKSRTFRQIHCMRIPG